MVFVVAVAAPWGDFKRGEAAGDEPRGQSGARVCDPSLWALRAGSAANLERIVLTGRVRAVG